MKLTEAMNALGEARKASQLAYAGYQSARQAEEEARQVVELELRSLGLKSAKGEDYVATITTRPQFRITSEGAAIAWIENQPNIDHDLYIGLKKTQFDTLARTALQTTGEVPAGVEVEMNEYLSIRSVKNNSKKEVK